jgi:hypothetical protein
MMNRENMLMAASFLVGVLLVIGTSLLVCHSAISTSGNIPGTFVPMQSVAVY